MRIITFFLLESNMLRQNTKKTAYFGEVSYARRKVRPLLSLLADKVCNNTSRDRNYKNCKHVSLLSKMQGRQDISYIIPYMEYNPI